MQDRFVCLIHFLPPRAGLSAIERWRHRALVAVVDRPAETTSEEVLARWLAAGGYPAAHAADFDAEGAPVVACPPAA